MRTQASTSRRYRGCTVSLASKKEQRKATLPTNHHALAEVLLLSACHLLLHSFVFVKPQITEFAFSLLGCILCHGNSTTMRVASTGPQAQSDARRLIPVARGTAVCAWYAHVCSAQPHRTGTIVIFISSFLFELLRIMIRLQIAESAVSLASRTAPRNVFARRPGWLVADVSVFFMRCFPTPLPTPRN